MNLSKRVLSILLSLLFVLPLPLLTAGRARAQAPNVYLDPTPLMLGQVGASGTLKVKLENVPGSAGFEFELSFDNTIVRVDSITVLVPTSGVFPVKKIDNEGGTVTFGAAALCEGGVCPNILNGTPLELAEITLSAVGEGTTGLDFNTSDYILYGTEIGPDNMPVRIEAALTNGRVQVGEPDGGATINLSAGGNHVVWPGGLGEFTSSSALESIQADCGSAPAISRKKGGWWESAVYGYGGVNFGLSEGNAVYIRVASSCVWTP